MASLLLSILALICGLGAAAATVYLFRQQSRLREELNQNALDVAVLHEKLKQAREAIGTQSERISTQQEESAQRIEELSERFDRVEMYAGVCVPPKPAASGFNINKRVEVIRLFQDGFSEEEIAEQLFVPLGEVRLLIYLEKNKKATEPQSTRRTGAKDMHAA